MIEIFRTPVRRISVAFVFSVLIHSVVLWLPQIHFSHDKLLLPPLVVRLEQVSVHETQPETQSESRLPVEPEPEALLNHPGAKLSGKPAINTAAMMKIKRMEKSSEKQRFPKNLYLFYTIYKGSGIFRMGEALHQFNLQGDKYTLKAIKHTTGLSSLLGGEQFVQTSRGTIGEQGLHPEVYSEARNAADDKREVSFDWAAQALHFANGGVASLPGDAQDALSFMYQFSQASLKKEVVQFPVSQANQLENYQLEIGSAENIDTPFGRLFALHLRKIHNRGDAYFEIWLGLEYRLLPVKFQQLNGAGEVIEEMVVSDIRASEE